MKLHWNPASPFVRKCLVCAAEVGIELELVTRAGTPLLTDNMPLEQNPLGKIPALERPDGPALYDSRVITRYLSAQGEGDLYPEARIWEVLTLEATADGIMDAAVLMVYESRTRPEEKQFADMVEAQWSKVARALDAIEERWMSHLAGPLDAAQIAVGVALEYLDFRHDGRGWRDGRPALAAWQAEFSKRESMVNTVPANL
ncbi:glutathione S-transferase family protein [Amylibacter sp. IMCC11727]|uniref:glutathione S-transferase family protein n=1 Tax=Amylibacter sp. IMCC11727 TaxID=3039851 RepID=UPI00244DE7E3|nr:glutathione S-transferase family protein [Amylibacter sp. IMCC11727]WGI21725.1 glutathione S-transferase family protein [Amylibacter sp. IMCC11727]